MNGIRPKKSLGQHFLKDTGIADRIAGSLLAEGCDSVLEIGPATGVLTRPLIEMGFKDFRVVEIDRNLVEYLKNNLGSYCDIIEGDFLELDLEKLFPGTLAITGNFPYNISAPILFKVLRYRDKVIELTGMFQREVAKRLCAVPGSKTYGIISVLIQAFYNVEYLFTVSENVFFPPPKVKSAVIRMRRNNTKHLNCDEELFLKVVKSSFNQRRKMLRNSLKSAFRLRSEDNPLLHLRPEQLTVEQFISLTCWVSENLVSE
ncbi:MAG TPA: 16S rRNA (adenine(1518)-N(6)/adenine(1519)-N(6))-dimethyltransferase RsmA [Bacteroidales bacterium]|mgnify:FL=1|nr:16S rRNA (adenine(1518)-N(6)/adenine(1519)-N(6))-dimethyltransferase [Bacteroidales bacterium]HOU96247.1 16S rRNA (adenine(1518)-N(6)/adenine(1519)-N(6))-dimethyltransferase RsmA [Bacteroidales bacterium]HQG36826.1 16S rRNA (adenine(1518)-N(6)/adenine(1519)-N(6))-dimethyltransferase RsmA [Bacteroidales bacterium]HQG53062.1 16S rRNA (adenine(1518)-N(6)/adenine(1519)-N(6))-dimethyltransferase RsmA [Bacteroidales bacterium]HQJ21003.1 16S rRNA (adenine(1518)-N(6)/adenine(1519)-N(6))-dimethyltran